MSLFPETEKAKNTTEPLAYRLAPKDFKDFIGQEQIVGKDSPIRAMIEQDNLVSLILWGPPGCGKTSLSRIISVKTNALYINMNAAMASIQDIKAAITKAQYHRDQQNKNTILFIDEIHRFTKVQQDALLPDVESGLLTLIGATTENPYFSVIPALLSRSQILEFTELSADNLKRVFDKALKDPQVKSKGYIWVPEAVDFILRQANGDARRVLNTIEMITFSIEPKSQITPGLIEQVTQAKGTKYNTDDHYDIVSAFIKSMRGSDADAAIYWLARMLKGGEDPVFITRRMVIFASEDVGNADPMALLMANAAFQTAKTIGMPEVQLNLSQVVAYLALAPKSNAATMAISKANQLISDGKIYPVPKHLKDSHYKGAKKQGFGEGYKYPHSFSGGYVKQDYMTPKETIYEPKDIGFEKTLKARKDQLK